MNKCQRVYHVKKKKEKSKLIFEQKIDFENCGDFCLFMIKSRQIKKCLENIALIGCASLCSKSVVMLVCVMGIIHTKVVIHIFF